MDNPYLHQIYNVLPRTLALFDVDPYSPTYGLGDRFYWGWKLIDFGNGTFQGAANGLARLMKHKLLPDWLSNEAVNKRIEAMFAGAEKLRRSNGSMEEAFPYESSFCVTALVAYDLLTSVEILHDELSGAELKRRLGIVEPMIAFLLHADEHHGIISNHLATASVALYKWALLTGDEAAERRGKLFLDRILAHYSSEGWFQEYEGADPGYQTLGIYYLADLCSMRPDLLLEPTLQQAVRFLSYFAHPDGSFGGLYGSRSTRLFFPAGIEFLVGICPEAAALAVHMRHSIAAMNTVTLLSMDDSNLVPMFNCYAWAATLFQTATLPADLPKLPCQVAADQHSDFIQAGLKIRGTKNHYTVINTSKGGVVASYSRDGLTALIDSGAVVRVSGRHFTTQVIDPEAKVTEDDCENSITVTTDPAAMNHRLPQPWQFVVLRLLNITLMRSIWFGNIIKRLLVKLLITGKRRLGSPIARKIDLQGELAQVSNNWADGVGPPGAGDITAGGVSKSIHMASAGYWQRGDDR